MSIYKWYIDINILYCSDYYWYCMSILKKYIDIEWLTFLMLIRAWYVNIDIILIDIEYMILIMLIWAHYCRIKAVHRYRIIRMCCVDMSIVVNKWRVDSIFPI